MPNVAQMESRLLSHLARVSGKALGKEIDRSNRLLQDGKVSSVTHSHMVSTAAMRLAWLANAA